MEWIPGTSNICERLFSRAKLNLGDMRHRLAPMHLESQLFLYVNKPYWDQKLISELVRVLLRLILVALWRKIFCEALIARIHGKLSLRAIIYFLMFYNEELFLRNPCWKDISNLIFFIFSSIC